MENHSFKFFNCNQIDSLSGTKQQKVSVFHEQESFGVTQFYVQCMTGGFKDDRPDIISWLFQCIDAYQNIKCFIFQLERIVNNQHNLLSVYVL